MRRVARALILPVGDIAARGLGQQDHQRLTRNVLRHDGQK